MLMLSISILALSFFHKVLAFEPPQPIDLPEDTLLSNLRIREREHARFIFKVTDEWNGHAHLSITAFATSFNSDPDIYISQVNSKLTICVAPLGHIYQHRRLVLHSCGV